MGGSSSSPNDTSNRSVAKGSRPIFNILDLAALLLIVIGRDMDWENRLVDKNKTDKTTNNFFILRPS